MSNQPPTTDQIRAAARSAVMQILSGVSFHTGDAIAAALAYADKLPPARPDLAAPDNEANELIEDLADELLDKLSITAEVEAEHALVIATIGEAYQRSRHAALRFAVELAQAVPSGAILAELRAVLAEIEAQQ